MGGEAGENEELDLMEVNPADVGRKPGRAAFILTQLKNRGPSARGLQNEKALGERGLVWLLSPLLLIPNNSCLPHGSEAGRCVAPGRVLKSLCECRLCCSSRGLRSLVRGKKASRA